MSIDTLIPKKRSSNRRRSAPSRRASAADAVRSPETSRDGQTGPSSDQAGAPSPSELPDGELLVQYRQTGDRQLFSRLVRRYERELFSYLRRYLGNAEMAEDVFQATFLQVHLKCEQFEEGRRFRPWLYTIATNQAIDAQRRNRRHRMISLDRAAGAQQREEVGRLLDLLESEDIDPLSHASRREQGQWVREAVGELSEPMRDVVELVYYRGLKYREAADILEIPVGTVKSRLHAAIGQLTNCWEESHMDYGVEQEGEPGQEQPSGNRASTVAT